MNEVAIAAPKHAIMTPHERFVTERALTRDNCADMFANKAKALIYKNNSARIWMLRNWVAA